MGTGLQFGTNVYKFPKFGPAVEPLVEFVQTAERVGFHHMRFLDHVVGIVAERHGGIANTPYTSDSIIRETFTVLAYLSAVTSKIGFVTGVLVLPQRQTTLIAKQAAEVDILSKGRLTLGVGLGYNQVEYEAMGASFKDRVPMFEEQVEVLRLLWTQEEVSFEGRFHKLTDVSLSPRPIQRPIPLYFGMGRSFAPIPPDAVLRRCGRLADGWLPIFKPDEEGRAAVAKVHEAAIEAGRDPAQLQMEMGLDVQGLSASQISDEIKRRQDFGATRIHIALPGDSPQEQTESLKRVADVLHQGWLG
ncbi:MAG: class F420-dependent oxidoreductase [Phenylobacterium sp.]|nr:class F420-dependent oxidoreductase [Phenylobacterium sp.]